MGRRSGWRAPIEGLGGAERNRFSRAREALENLRNGGLDAKPVSALSLGLARGHRHGLPPWPFVASLPVFLFRYPEHFFNLFHVEVTPVS